MKRIVILLLAMAITGPMYAESAKKIQAEIDAKVQAKAKTLSSIDASTLKMQATLVYLNYNRCEEGRGGLKGMFRKDPCKIALMQINDSLK